MLLREGGARDDREREPERRVPANGVSES
jgi:hypothetical protein